MASVTKMHGLGNDFVIGYLKNFKWCITQLSNIAVEICDRHKGIGADGLILYDFDDDNNPTMSIWNSDGSEAEMCGNGIRCLAYHLYDLKLVQSESFKIKTKAGFKEVFVDTKTKIDDSKKFVKVKTVNVGVVMGFPEFLASKIPVKTDEEFFIDKEINVLDRTFKVSAVSMGNPHAVIFVDSDFSSEDFYKYGPAIEKHELFPKFTNVEFVNYKNPHEFSVRVWERGAGETLACGTGACAVYAVACRLEKTSLYADIHLPGGTLRISTGKNGVIQMTGSATEVFSTKIELPFEDL